MKLVDTLSLIDRNIFVYELSKNNLLIETFYKYINRSRISRGNHLFNRFGLSLTKENK